MKFKNECGHPEEDYLFTMDIENDTFDVWYYRHSLGDKNEFCLRYGNEDHEYKSRWDCAWIERSISHHSKFAYDNEDSAKDRDQLIEFKTKLKEAGYWDIDWNLDAEIIELKATVDNYNDSCRVVVIG